MPACYIGHSQTPATFTVGVHNGSFFLCNFQCEDVQNTLHTSHASIYADVCFHLRPTYRNTSASRFQTSSWQPEQYGAQSEGRDYKWSVLLPLIVLFELVSVSVGSLLVLLTSFSLAVASLTAALQITGNGTFHFYLYLCKVN